ncbi:MAG: triose-phosphate isomerase [Bacteroidia bacterium]|nr:MAG: triose-phosphate isomerase [Bacteroidia bacterium]
MRKKIVAGNWKMNTTLEEGISLASEIKSKVAEIPSVHNKTEIILAPPFTHLYSVKQAIANSNILLSAQNCASETEGAYTGEVSANMLQSCGCDCVIIGHSERRAYYHETSQILLKKIKQALAKDMRIIFCCGEKLEDREAEKHFSVVEKQLQETVGKLSTTDLKQIVLAYEPVWAIGTGVTASKEQAQEMHAFIRKIIADNFGSAIAEETSILYGGSVKPSNAADLFAQPDVDGGLIGGAALQAESFLSIIKAQL